MYYGHKKRTLVLSVVLLHEHEQPTRSPNECSDPYGIRSIGRLEND